MKQKTDKVNPLEKDYNKIVKDFKLSDLSLVGNDSNQVVKPNDSFVKFSLYSETPNSISSTDTLMVNI